MLAEANEVAPPQMESAIKGFGMLPSKPLTWFVATKALLAKNESMTVFVKRHALSTDKCAAMNMNIHS